MYIFTSKWDTFLQFSNDEFITVNRNTNIFSLINKKNLKFYPTGRAANFSDYSQNNLFRNSEF
jgi:hypothetical protein